MRYEGNVSDFGTEWGAFDFEVPEALVTSTKVAVHWKDGDESIDLIATSSDGGLIYEGTLGNRVQRAPVTVTRYDARDGDMILIVERSSTDVNYGIGWFIVELGVSEE